MYVAWSQPVTQALFIQWTSLEVIATDVIVHSEYMNPSMCGSYISFSNCFIVSKFISLQAGSF